MKDIVVYTALIDNYDDLQFHPFDERCDYICFTDNRKLRSDFYDVRYCDREYKDPVRDARKFKILSHICLPEYKYSIWIDASSKLLIQDYVTFVSSVLNEYDIAMIAHNNNDDIYCELERCIKWKRDDPSIMKKQVGKYAKTGYPRGSGLVATQLIVRKNMSPIVRKINEDWWYEILNGSRRDQLSFNYVMWKNKMGYKVIDKLSVKNGCQSKYHKVYGHKKDIYASKYESRISQVLRALKWRIVGH